MMKTISIITFGLMAIATTADARGGSHMVQGYTRSNGTYVAPHVSANPGTYTPVRPAAATSYPVTSDHSVSGYVKKDGTYVAPYRATNPDGTRNDNYSTRGNTNPYTGQQGTKPRDGE